MAVVALQKKNVLIAGSFTVLIMILTLTTLSKRESDNCQILWVWPDINWEWPGVNWEWPDVNWEWPDINWGWPDINWECALSYHSSN